MLTPAEWDVVPTVQKGMSNRRIAEARGISVDAVKYHMKRILSKLGLDSRVELAERLGAPIESSDAYDWGHEAIANLVGLDVDPDDERLAVTRTDWKQ